jgi:hypothetical protein
MSNYQNRCKFLLLALLLCCLPNILSAQGANGTRRNSPYSRYGMGDMADLSFMPNQMMAGSFSATYGSTHDINLQNPASLGLLRYTSFELSAYYQRANLTENTANSFNKSVSNDGNFSYFSLAFPINRTWEQRRSKIQKDSTSRSFPIQWGMSFSLLPYSRVGYDVAVTRTLPDIGDVNYNYVGQGSRYRLNWGNGWRHKDFSLGLNVGFVFGAIDDITVVDFKDSTYNFAFDNKSTSSEYARGVVLDVGLQKTFRFKDNRVSSKPKKAKTDWVIKVGAAATLNSQLSTDRNVSFVRSGTFYSRDTVLSSSGQTGTITLPLQTRAGIAFGLENRWLIGFNHQYTNFSTFSNSLNSSAKLKNANLFSLGGEWTPMIESRESYFDRISYRAGLYYGEDGRFIETANNEILALKKYGINFGVTLPIETRVKSALSEIVILSFGAAHFGFEFGYLTHPDLIRERYFQVNVGFTINDDKWFKRTKFR